MGGLYSSANKLVPLYDCGSYPTVLFTFNIIVPHPIKNLDMTENELTSRPPVVFTVPEQDCVPEQDVANFNSSATGRLI